MAIVMVHGYPATSHLWDPVITALGPIEEPVIALDLPGFKHPPPEGWQASKENYVDWLVAQLADIAKAHGPVNLVGHDWGCLLSTRVATLRPDLVRTLVVSNGPVDEHYPLHDSWRVWARPGEGEAAMEALTPEFIRENFTVVMPEPYIDSVCALLNPWSKRVGLELYRSAVNVGREWAPDLPKIVAPCMIIWGEDDMVVPVHFGRRMAARMGAEFVTVPGTHFWQLEHAAQGAAHLRSFWQQFADYQVPQSVLHDLV